MSKEKLLRLLIDKKQPITSKNFAKNLGVSSRTIINYIKEINESHGETVISSGHHGYSASIEKVINILKEMQYDRDIPQNFEERASYVVRNLLFKVKKLNIHDLSTELYVSASTIKHDITKINDLYKGYRCVIKYSNDDIYIEGSDDDKRLLLAYIIRKETVGSLLDLNILEDLFEGGFIRIIHDSLRLTIEEHHLSINDYAFMNVLLHLSIIIDNQVPNLNFKHIDLSNMNQITRDFYDKISKQEVLLNQSQVTQIEQILNIQFNTANSGVEKYIEKTIKRETLANARLICKNAGDMFNINFSNDAFLLPFSHHLELLLIRLQNMHNEKNPMTEMIKRDNPIIYEVAVFITAQIINIYALNVDAIPEDEIAFIALHVGSALTNNRSSHEKLKAVLVCPEYKDTRENLINNINTTFSNELVITHAFSYPHEVQDTEYDILFKTVPDDIYMTENSLLIHLFDYEKSRIRIQNKITNIQNIKNSKIILNDLNSIVSKELYSYSEASFVDEYEAIQFMGETLLDLSIIDQLELDSIKKREQISSTTYGHYAIPHSLIMNAKQTRISILVLPEGIKWNQSTVYLIMLITIQECDQHNFDAIYQSLISLLKDENVSDLAKQMKHYEDFINYLRDTNKFVT